MMTVKFGKRENDIERCLYMWTRWFTVVWDFGSTQCRGSDEFGLVITYRAWGPTFYWGRRDIENLGERRKFDRLQFTRIQPRYAEQRKKFVSDRDFCEAREQDIREGKRRNPVGLTYQERHEETKKAIAKMEFSNNFVHLMTTPVCKLALERGEEVRDDVDGTLLTYELFEEHKAKYIREPVANPILGFQKAEDGEGYKTIFAPGCTADRIGSGRSGSLQLEDGR